MRHLKYRDNENINLDINHDLSTWEKSYFIPCQITSDHGIMVHPKFFIYLYHSYLKRLLASAGHPKGPILNDYLRRFH